MSNFQLLYLKFLFFIYYIMSVNLPLNSKFSLKKELPCREETYFFAPAGGEKT